MILICVKWQIKPEYADRWPEIAHGFTEATRAEPGNRFFDWFRSLETPNEYALLEAFDDEAADAHVTSDHFKRAQVELPAYLQQTPQIRNWQQQPDEWDHLGEFEVS